MTKFYKEGKVEKENSVIEFQRSQTRIQGRSEVRTLKKRIQKLRKD